MLQNETGKGQLLYFRVGEDMCDEVTIKLSVSINSVVMGPLGWCVITLESEMSSKCLIPNN